MRIEPFSLTLSSPLHTARAEVLERTGFLIHLDPAVDDEVAAPGIGEATPLPGWTESLESCERALKRIASLDPAEVPAASHGVALATVDAAARDAEVSVADWLADRADLPAPSTSVPVNATIGDGTPEATVTAATRAVTDGYHCLKIKVGARKLGADVERLKAVRTAVGPGVSIRADANGAWSRSTAREALDHCSTLDLEYVEQPLPATDLAGVARLREASSVPIAVDESLSTYSLPEILEAAAADVVVLKPMALGGPMETLTAATRARQAGVEPIVTTTIDGVVARTGAVHVAAAIPDVGACGLATGALLRSDLGPDPCHVEDGVITVPDEPGLAGGSWFDGR